MNYSENSDTNEQDDDAAVTRLSTASPQDYIASDNYELSAGDMIGDYEVISLLGVGGMGYVYEARHQVLHKVYAIKTIRAELLTETIWRRMQIEAQAIARMNHPNIVGIHNFGMHEGRPFYVMDLLRGTSLAEKLKSQGPLSVTEALPIFREVATGLNYAHKKGIIHRDIKPGNIILLKKADSTGAKVKIVDFGIAKLAGTSDPNNQNLTSMGEIFGSPLYMSPEQCLAERTDARSDAYALGCTMFEALTGQPPFRGNNQVQTMMLHQGAPIPSLAEKSKKKTQFPEALELVLTKMLAKKPMERYQNLAAVVEDLDKITASLELPEENDQSNQLKRNVAVAVVAIALCTIVVGILAFLAVGGSSNIPALTRLFVGQQDFSTSKVESKINEETATKVKYEKEDKDRLVGPICKYEKRNQKLVKVFTFPKTVFGTIYNEASEKDAWLASGTKEYAADDELLFASHGHMMTHPENFKAFRNGDFWGIRLRYLGEGKPAKSDSFFPTPEATMCDLRGALLQMAHLDKLSNLSLAHCSQLTDKDIVLLNQFPKLTHLDLTNTNANGNEVAKLPFLKHLKNLDFSTCPHITPVLRALAGSKSMLWLKINSVSGGHLTKEDIRNIATMPNLKILELDDNAITNDDIEILSSLPKLTKLSAQNGTVDENAIKSFKKMKAIEEVTVKNKHWTVVCEKKLKAALKR